MSVVLLVEDKDGMVAVRFPNLDAARAWEDKHEMRLDTVRGVCPIVTPAEALRMWAPSR